MPSPSTTPDWSPTVQVNIKHLIDDAQCSQRLSGNITVFNIAGNAYRLITVIHFNTGRVYVRSVLTHAAYTRGTWRDD
jgi:mRNA interferase HigB